MLIRVCASLLFVILLKPLYLLSDDKIPRRSFIEAHGGIIWSGGYTTYTLPEKSTLTLQSNEVIRVDKLIINGTVFTNGNLFSVEAREVQFGPEGKIIGYETAADQGKKGTTPNGNPSDEPTGCFPNPSQGKKGTNGSPGGNGMSGRKDVEEIRVFAFRLTGKNNPVIHGDGQKGGKGGDGGNGQAGGKGASGSSVDSASHFYCVRGDNSTGGGDAGPGGQPGSGGDPGRGGDGGAPIPVSYLLGVSSSGNVVEGDFSSLVGQGGLGGMSGLTGSPGLAGTPGAGGYIVERDYSGGEFGDFGSGGVSTDGGCIPRFKSGPKLRVTRVYYPPGRDSHSYNLSREELNSSLFARSGLKGEKYPHSNTPLVQAFNQISVNRDGAEQAWLSYFWISKLHQLFIDSIRLMPELTEFEDKFTEFDQNTARRRILSELRGGRLSYKIPRNAIIKMALMWKDSFYDIIKTELSNNSDPDETAGLKAALNLAEDIYLSLSDIASSDVDNNQDDALSSIFNSNLEYLLQERAKLVTKACTVYNKLVNAQAAVLKQSVDFLTIPSCNSVSQFPNTLIDNPYQDINLQTTLSEAINQELVERLDRKYVNFIPNHLDQEFGSAFPKNTFENLWEHFINPIVRKFLPEVYAQETQPELIYLRQMSPLNIKSVRNAFRENSKTELTSKGVILKMTYPTAEDVSKDTIRYFLEVSALQSIYLRRK